MSAQPESRADMARPPSEQSTATSSSKQDTPTSSTQNKRRRGVGIVTPNACTECRKKRAKCDGQTPCGRCESNSTECVYEIPVRQSKEAMRQEIDQLQTNRRQAERLVTSLTSGHKIDETLNRLRNGQSLEDVSHWLENEAMSAKGSSSHETEYTSPGQQNAIQKTMKMAESLITKFESGAWPSWNAESSKDPLSDVHGHGDDAMNWQSEGVESDASPELTCPLFGTGQIDDETSTDMQNARGRGQNFILGPTYSISHRINDVSLWTSVTDNAALVEHLMALYFCWEYPTFASLSKEHFLTDFRSGQPRYCSSLLVNAMCALGCRFSTLPQSRSIPDDPETSGEHFYAEAKRLLFEDDHTSLTTIQALGLMSIREASCGGDTESYYLAGQAIRLSVEFGLHIEASDRDDKSVGGMDHEVRSATFWGAFALDSAWSLTIGRIPHFSRRAKLVQKPAIIEQIEASEWVPYSDHGAPTTKAASQPSNVRSVFRCFAELSELVHQSLYTLYTPGRHLASSEVVSMYFRFLNWYSSLPEVLRLGHNFTPAVLFAHMYYHFAILLLLRPFIKLRFVGSGVSPRDVCAQAADAITTLIRSYDNLYSLARTPSFVPYIALASSIEHLVIAATADISSSQSPAQESHQSHNYPPGSQVVQAAQDLKSLSSCHGFSKRGLDIVRFLAHHWDISSNQLGGNHKLNLSLGSPSSSAKDSPSRSALEKRPSEETETNMADIKSRCTMRTKSLNLFSPDMRETMPDVGPRSELALFSPFPMQGIPLLAGEEDDLLRKDGFERLPHWKGSEESETSEMHDEADR